MMSGRGRDDFPFMLHLDMYSLPFNDCENKKLETVCTHTFRQKIHHVETLSEYFIVYLDKPYSDASLLAELLDLFMIGINVKCFHTNEVTKKSTMVFESRVSGVLWRPGVGADSMEAPYELLQHDDVPKLAFIYNTAASQKVHVALQIVRNAEVHQSPISHKDLYASEG